MKSVIARLALSGVALAVTVVAAEQLLRLGGYEYMPVSVNVHTTEDTRYYHLFGSESFVYDPDLIWKPRPSDGPFNAQGFRGPLMGTRDRGKRLLLVAIGDSNTLGWAGREGANWPRELDRRLEAAGIAADVVNAGVWGYSSYQGVTRLRQILAYRPDVVLVSFGSNDAHRVRRSDRDFAGRTIRFRRLERVVTHYRLGQLATAAAHAVVDRGDALEPRVSLEHYREHLRTMARLCRQAGVSIVLVTRPFELEIPNDLWWKNFGADYNLAVAEIALEVGVPLIDFYSYFKGRRRLFADESHFTDEGHELAAAIALAELRPILAEISGEG